MLVAVVAAVLMTRSNADSQTTAAAQVASAPPTAVTTARTITAREWQAIAADPDAHKGERVKVYGQILRLDTAAGASQFRAAVDGVRHSLDGGYASYTSTAVLTGKLPDLLNVVERELFEAEVTVLGSTTYVSDIGGTVPAPALSIDSIKITGSAR